MHRLFTAVAALAWCMAIIMSQAAPHQLHLEAVCFAHNATTGSGGSGVDCFLSVPNFRRATRHLMTGHIVWNDGEIFHTDSTNLIPMRNIKPGTNRVAVFHIELLDTPIVHAVGELEMYINVNDTVNPVQYQMPVHREILVKQLGNDYVVADAKTQASFFGLKQKPNSGFEFVRITVVAEQSVPTPPTSALDSLPQPPQNIPTADDLWMEIETPENRSVLVEGKGLHVSIDVGPAADHYGYGIQLYVNDKADVAFDHIDSSLSMSMYVPNLRHTLAPGFHDLCFAFFNPPTGVEITTYPRVCRQVRVDGVRFEEQECQQESSAVAFTFPPDGYVIHDLAKTQVILELSPIWLSRFPTARALVLRGASGAGLALWNLDPAVRVGTTYPVTFSAESQLQWHWLNLEAVLIDANQQDVACPRNLGLMLKPDKYYDWETSYDVAHSVPCETSLRAASSSSCSDDSNNGTLCSGHGTCLRQGTCKCRGDWIGERCEISVFHGPEYLPSPEVLQSCHQVRSRIAASQKFFSDMQGFYSAAEGVLNSNGSNVEVLHVNTTPLGEEILRIANKAISALQKNKVLVVCSPSVYSYTDDFVQPFHMSEVFCNSELHERVFPNLSKNRPVDPKDPWEDHAAFIPRAYEEHGHLWFQAHFLDFLLRPSASLRHDVEVAKEAMGLQSANSTIGVHLRAGHNCIRRSMQPTNVMAHCPQLDEYVRAIVMMASKYNVRNVFVASDAGTATLLDFKTRLENENVVVTWMEYDRASLSSTVMLHPNFYHPHGPSHGGKQRVDLHRAALLDIMLLRECDYFVGTFSSKLSVAAFELMYARKGHAPPYLSLDSSGWRPQTSVNVAGAEWFLHRNKRGWVLENLS